MKKIVYDPDDDLFDELLFSDNVNDYEIRCPVCGGVLLVVTTAETARRTGKNWGLYCANATCLYEVVFHMSS